MSRAKTRQLPVSVIIASYNCGRYLRNAIESCLRQRVQPLEVIVIDDGSTDQTESILRSYENSPLVKIRRQANQGVSAARNSGVEMSTGEYLLFLDADDEFLPGSLEEKHAILARYPDVDFFISEYMKSDVPGLMHPAFASLNAESVFQTYCSSCGDDIIRLDERFAVAYANGHVSQSLVWTGAVMLRRQLFDQVGGFRHHLRVGEDLDLWRRCLTSGTSAVVRRHCGAIYFTWRGQKEKFEALFRQSVGKIKEETRKKSPFSAPYWSLRNKIARQYINIIWCYNIYTASRTKAFKFLILSIYYYPFLQDQIKIMILMALPKNVLVMLYSRRQKASRCTQLSESYD